MKIKSLILLCLITQLSQTKVLIFTYAFNRPDFIEVQHKTFEHLLEDEYEFVVFSDAKNPQHAKDIRSTCERLGIKHISIPQEIHNRPYLPREREEKNHAPAVRNVNAVMYSLKEGGGFAHDDILVLLDSDVFLVKKLSIRKLLEGYDIAAMPIGNGYITYLWHGLCCLNMRTLPNIESLTFNCGKVNGKPVDAGGHSYYYLRDHPEVKTHFVNYFHTNHFRCPPCAKNDNLICTHNTELLKEKNFEDYLITFLQNAHNVDFYHNASFLHYRGGTNWDGKNKQYHIQKTAAFEKFIDHSLSL